MDIAKIDRQANELVTRLEQQIELLKLACDNFDSGKEIAGLTIPINLIVLVHYTGNSISLLKQLDLKDIDFFDTSFDINDRAVYLGLVIKSIGTLIDGVGGPVLYKPILASDFHFKNKNWGNVKKCSILINFRAIVGVLEKLGETLFYSYTRYNTLETEYDLLKTPIAQPKVAPQNDSVYTETIKGVSFDMIKIPSQNFYIAETQATQALWQTVMGNNPSGFAGKLQNPVERVSWEDVVKDFLPALNTLTGKTYRLPTRAEWEYSAMGGENYKYAGSNQIKEVAWYKDNSGDTTHPVKQKKANAYGLHDMSGNVLEWCEDWYDNTKITRVLRGGSWFRASKYCAPSYRSCYAPAGCGPGVGFRLVFLLS